MSPLLTLAGFIIVGIFFLRYAYFRDKLKTICKKLDIKIPYNFTVDPKEFSFFFSKIPLNDFTAESVRQKARQAIIHTIFALILFCAFIVIQSIALSLLGT